MKAATMARRRRDRRYALLAAAALGALLSLGLLLATTAKLPWQPVSPASPVAGSQPRTATVAFKRAGDRCRQLIFSGRMVDAGKPCEDGSMRADGEPKGTARRLDAISRSFLKK